MSVQSKTKIKICGLTREVDVDAAVMAGVDAIGFVMYSQSPRAVSIERAAELAKRLPPFVTPVLLYVNALEANIHAGFEAIPQALLQFHGDETPAFCNSFNHPYLRAARIFEGFDLVKYSQQYASAQGLLLDAHVVAFGGSGTTFNWKAFNWSQLSINVKLPLVLSGGLTSANVAEGIALVKPWAVDVSSGVERSKGIKDPQKIAAFVAAVRSANS
jgi:phosphoribosylanthranilate isomerase